MSNLEFLVDGWGSNWHRLYILGNLWCDSLSCAVNDRSALDKTLDHPVTLSTAENTTINAAWAKIKVSIITGTAMIMLIWDSSVAVVAVDGENALSGNGWVAKETASAAFMREVG
jgi:hypothetical protein